MSLQPQSRKYPLLFLGVLTTFLLLQATREAQSGPEQGEPTTQRSPDA